MTSGNRKIHSPLWVCLAVNALAAADSVIIPVQAQYLTSKGLENLTIRLTPLQPTDE